MKGQINLQKELERIVRREARRIAGQKTSCRKCVWDRTPFCAAPYSDMTVSELCYFGVYRYLSGEVSPEETALIRQLEAGHEKDRAAAEKCSSPVSLEE